jgi:hypothetical protein
MNDYTYNDTEGLPSSEKKPKRGRPAFKVEWPEVEFTAEEIYHTLEKKLSRVSIHAKINKALGQGVLSMVGKIKPRTGRPKIVYKRVATQQCQD